MDELQRNKETFQLIKSIEAAQSQENNTTSNNNKVSILRYLSINHIRDTFPQESPYTSSLINSLRLLRLSFVIYFINFISTALLFFLKFQLFSIFSLAYALLLIFIAPALAFFTAHYPLLHSASIENDLFKLATVAVSLAGFALQSLCWCLMGIGLLSGASGGIFSVLNLLNSKEWPLFLVGALNLLFLTVAFFYSLHLEQKIFRTILLK